MRTHCKLSKNNVFIKINKNKQNINIDKTKSIEFYYTILVAFSRQFDSIQFNCDWDVFNNNLFFHAIIHTLLLLSKMIE